MAMTPNGAELPCRNPNCKSHGQSHPNCRCYGRADIVSSPSGPGRSKFSGPAKASAGSRANMAEGGMVEGHYCDSGREHHEGCEYYKEGGLVKNPEAAKHAHSYMRAKGIPISKRSTYHPVDPSRGKAIAAEFQKMEHQPHDPDVKAAYNALIDETLDQFQQMKKAGLKIEKMKPGENPYKNSGDMHKDVAKGHLWFYPTEQGHGPEIGTHYDDHPMLQPTGEVVDGHQMLANDVFRVVHDYFGHAKEGYGFGPRGEENAWREHSKMFSKQARRALTTETRGQNSWVNFGPYGRQNKEHPSKTVYADQKAGLLPEWVSEDPEELVHYSQHPGELKTVDPKFMGTGKAGRESERTGRIPRQYYYEPGSQPEDLVMQGAKRVHRIARPHDIIDIASEEAQPILQGARDEDHLEELLRDAGFSGYKNSASQVPGAVALFGEHPVLDSEEMTPAHFKKAAGYADGGMVEAEPMDKVGSQCLQDALANGFLRGHGDISDAILGHSDPTPLVAGVIANGGAPSLLKMGSSSVFSPRVAMRQATTADRSHAFLSGVGTAHHAGLPSSIEALSAGLDHPWFRKGADFHQMMPALQADPKADADLEPMAEKLVGRDVHGSAQDFLGPTAVKLLSQGATPDEFEHGIHFAEHVGKGLQKIDKAIKNLFDPEAEANQPDLKMRDKLHKYVSEGKLHDEVLQELSRESTPVTEGTDPIAKHFADPNMLLQQARAGTVNYLNSVRPQAQPALMFDTPFATNMAKRKYDQALDAAVNPLSVLTKIKTGTITPTDVVSLEAMYPQLYDYLKQKMTERLSEVKANKGSVIPKIRRAMSLFLGTPLDSTMTPASIQNVQAMYAKQRQASQAQQQPAGGAAKTGTPHLDKVSQNSQTNAQALAARQQRPR